MCSIFSEFPDPPPRGTDSRGRRAETRQKMCSIFSEFPDPPPRGTGSRGRRAETRQKMCSIFSEFPDPPPRGTDSRGRRAETRQKIEEFTENSTPRPAVGYNKGGHPPDSRTCGTGFCHHKTETRHKKRGPFLGHAGFTAVWNRFSQPPDRNAAQKRGPFLGHAGFTAVWNRFSQPPDRNAAQKEDHSSGTPDLPPRGTGFRNRQTETRHKKRTIPRARRIYRRVEPVFATARPKRGTK